MERKNPLLEKVHVPGEKFRLPSSGVFYTNGELSDNVKNGEVYVTAMNAMDELVLKSPDKLLSGEAVTEILKRCVPDVLKPEELLAKDVDYLLMALRMVSYGTHVELNVKHNCENAKDHRYSIAIRPILQATKPIDPVAAQKFKVVLDNGQVVRLHPPRYLSTVKMYQVFSLNNEDVSTEKMGKQLLDSLADMIIDVDGHNVKEDISEWLQKVRVGDVQKISDMIATLSDWGLNPVVEVACRDCQQKIKVDVPVNPIAFFT